jgi:hypothetical protein
LNCNFNFRHDQSGFKTQKSFQPKFCPLHKAYCLLSIGPLFAHVVFNFNSTSLTYVQSFIFSGVCHYSRWCGKTQECLNWLRDVDLHFCSSHCSQLLGSSVGWPEQCLEHFLSIVLVELFCDLFIHLHKISNVYVQTSMLGNMVI